MRPPQCSHFRTSTLKTRANSSAHGMRDGTRTSEAVAAPRGSVFSEPAAATEAVGSAIALDEIAKRENVAITDDDLDVELQRYAEQTGHSVPSIKARLQKDGELGRLAAGVRREKAVTFVMSKARIKKS